MTAIKLLHKEYMYKYIYMCIPPPIIHDERAQVGDARRRQQHVTDDVVVRLAQRLDVLRPARLLAAQTADELLGAHDLHLRQIDVVFQVLETRRNVM